MNEIARDVAILELGIVNAYLVGTGGGWVLIDSGLPGSAPFIQHAVEKRFGPGARPRAIILTHGHFDHAGSSKTLAEYWKVSVYAHRLEWPYLNGKSSYPPLDPTAPGVFSALSRAFPGGSTVDLDGRLAEIGTDFTHFDIDGWTVHHTPGHAPGQVSFFRESDRLLIPGDAVTTMDVDTVVGLVSKKQQVCRPPAPATTDWRQARDSVRLLAALNPDLIAAGHGKPLANASSALWQLAELFPIPSHGRYVPTPAVQDEDGIVSLPPKPVDLFPILLGAAAALTAAHLVFRRKE